LTNASPTHRITLVIATGNCGKFNEIAALLSGVDACIVPLDRVGPIEVPPESGDSFQENARRKAVGVARGTGYVSLADDSGLEVDALGGRPGVWSARFGGPGKTDAERNALLLDRLAGVCPGNRGARFRCAVAVADPRGAVHVTEGVCEGRIALVPRGEQGFGYDPVFEIPALGKTLAEMDSETKGRLSHRGQAIRAAREILERLLLTPR
jgi:XTP/dITP diphosphohydrolase